jgi:hypothetical protein
MPAPLLITCLVLVGSLVLVSVIAFVRSHRRRDPLGALVGLLAMLSAGIPAAAYGAMSAF